MEDFEFNYSMVLLTYNQEAFVADAVRGALGQQCPPIEIVISDDCSDDATFKIIQEIVGQYRGPHKVVLNCNLKNLGLVRHIDRIHEISSGDVIIVAAGDDVSLPARCQTIIRCFEREHPLLVCSDAKVIDQNGAASTPTYRSATFYKTTDIKNVAHSHSLYLGATGAWHRDLYSKYGPIEEGAYEDLVMGFRAALEGRVAVLKEELVIYKLGYGITSSKQRIKTADDLFQQEIRTCRLYKAVSTQRRKDALTFGYTSQSTLLNIINRNLLRSEIGIIYYSGGGAAILWVFLKHPILLLRQVYITLRILANMLWNNSKD